MALRFVVPFGRDGAADRAARAFASAYARCGAGADSVAVEDVPGRGGFTGLEHANGLANAGEALLLLGTPTTHILLSERLGPGAAVSAEFRPLAGLGSAPNVLLVTSRMGVASLPELVSRARSGQLTYASAGEGQTIHVCTALFCALAGIEMVHRPYDRGSATAYADLEAGRVHVYFDNLLGSLDRIQGSGVIPLAVSSERRSHLLPEVPTLRELGYEHSLDVWLGVFSAHLAPDRDTDRLLTDEGLRTELRALGLAGGPASAEQLEAEVDRSKPRWIAAAAAIRA